MIKVTNDEVSRVLAAENLIKEFTEDYCSAFPCVTYQIEDVHNDHVYVNFTLRTDKDIEIILCLRIDKNKDVIEICIYEDIWETLDTEVFWRYLYFGVT